MTTPAITEGEWERVGNTVRTKRRADGTGGFEILTCWLGQPEHVANATAAAALPALLAACDEDLSGRPVSELLHDAARWMRDAGGGPLADCLADRADAIEAAMAKARGEA